MRYLITTHGCYRKHETVDLKAAKLLVYAYENECLRYGEEYYSSFCNKSIHKRKGNYKRKFIATPKYYQMEFSRLPGDNFPSYIKCCKTNKILYDFKNGDLLLSDVLDLITAYNDHVDPSPIYLSVLTCNTECSDKENTNFGEHLTVNRPPKLYPSSKKNWNVSRKSVTNARKKNMLIPASRGTLKHRFKPDNLAIESNGTRTLVTEDNRKRLKTRSYFLPQVNVGNVVWYQHKLWKIRAIQHGPVVWYDLVPLLEPSKRNKSKSFSSMLSTFKLKRKHSELNTPAEVEAITVDARETRKMEL
jgi:hypothetical protein